MGYSDSWIGSFVGNELAFASTSSIEMRACKKLKDRKNQCAQPKLNQTAAVQREESARFWAIQLMQISIQVSVAAAG